MNCDQCKSEMAIGYLAAHSVVWCRPCALRGADLERCVEVVDGDLAQDGTAPSNDNRSVAVRLGDLTRSGEAADRLTESLEWHRAAKQSVCDLKQEAEKLGVDLGDHPQSFADWQKAMEDLQEYRQQGTQPDADAMGYLHGRFGVRPEFRSKQYRVWLKSLSLQFYRHKGAWCCDLTWHDGWSRPAPRIHNHRHTGDHETLKQCADEAARLAAETLRSDLETLKGDQ